MAGFSDQFKPSCPLSIPLLPEKREPTEWLRDECETASCHVATFGIWWTATRWLSRLLFVNPYFLAIASDSRHFNYEVCIHPGEFS